MWHAESMRLNEFLRKLLGQSTGARKLLLFRIFAVPKSGTDLLRKLLLFVIYFWPTIYLAITGELLFHLD